MGMGRGVLGLLLGVLLVFPQALGAVDFSFGRASHLVLYRDVAGAVAIGDANGDGRLDIAVTEDLDLMNHRVSLFIQRVDGSFAPPVSTHVSDEFGWHFPVSFVDLDGDGREELVVGGRRLTAVRLANGVLEKQASEEMAFECAHLASGDIDGDGHFDVVCHSDLGLPSGANIHYGNGTGWFRNRVQMITDVGAYGYTRYFMSIQLADVTGDALPDLVVTAARADSFYVYPNNGVGGFDPVAHRYPHPVAPANVWPVAMKVLDLDGDGVNEVVTASPDNAPHAMLNVYRLGANGRLVLSGRSPVHHSPTALLAVDEGGPAGGVLAVAHFDFNAVSLVDANSGAAAQPRFEVPGFGAGVKVTGLNGTSKALAMGDIDGDGCPDLVATTNSGVVLLHGCRPRQTSVPVNDLDGDGVSDLLWLEPTAQMQLWRWADRSSWLTCAKPCPVSKSWSWEVQGIGDFDGDGGSDLFWRNVEDGRNVFLVSGFYERVLTSVTDRAWQVVGVGDFDGDDQSDLLWRHSGTGRNAIWLSASFARQQAVRAVTDLRWKVVGVGDFNGDGRSDILWRHSATGGNAIWLSGRFETQMPVTAVTNTAWEVQGIGDFNGDRKSDVFWRNTITGVNGIWLSADFHRQKPVTGVTNTAWNVGSVGDYNGDGVSDLTWRHGVSGQNVIWRSANYHDPQAVAAMGVDAVLIR